MLKGQTILYGKGGESKESIESYQKLYHLKHGLTNVPFLTKLSTSAEAALHLSTPSR